MESNNKSVHFIAIGGSAMHNLAIALSRKGLIVTGSDDEIFEPSKSRLEKEGILPSSTGWSSSNINTDIDAVILADAKTDLYNPNVIRSSVGCVFTNQIAIASSDEVIEFLKENKINIYSATLQNSNEYTEENYTEASALVVGTEATGLTEIWRDNAIQNINIPMQGTIDSMNVSVAAAILIFEAKRQRKI